MHSNFTFTYNGDGQHVKSVLTTNVGSTTTFFVGNHYEVTGGVVTKYYYAGSQRIAMRENSVLTYIISDHLGSTSLVTDASGNVISETKYKAWGETRYSSGTEMTKYQYTGQYSYASDFGLHFYNARWYDSSLGRFAQADTIIPSGIQGLDRYAYTNNNPVKYTDPSGHFSQCQSSYCNPNWLPLATPSTPITINVCGFGAGGSNGTCSTQQPNDPSYQNQVPLSNVSNWAAQNGYKPPEYFSANTADEKRIAAEAIYDFMLKKIRININAKFILVGHSGGADSVVWAIRLFLESGRNASHIQGVVLLDSYLFTGDGYAVGYPEKDLDGNLTGPLNNQKSGDMAIEAGIPILSLASQDKVNENGDHFTDFPFLSPPQSVGGGHKNLAVDLVIFTMYIEPFLNEVSK